ncbi:MAG: sugar transferase [Patescibacteria group bacterium]
MIKRRHSIKIAILLLVDIIFLYAALITGLFLRYSGTRSLKYMFMIHPFPFTVIFSVWIIVFGALGLYDLHLLKNSKKFLYQLIRVMAINTLLAIFLFYIFPFEIEPRRNLAIVVSLSTVFIFSWRYLFNFLILKTSTSQILFLGYNSEIDNLASYLLDNPQLGHKPVGFVTDQGFEKTNTGLPRYTTEQKLTEIIRITKTDTIVMIPELKENRILLKSLLGILPDGIWITEFPSFHEMLTGKIPLSLIEETWFLENLVGLRKKTYDFLKRGLDIILSIILGIPSILIYPILAIIIKIESSGPVFFRQKRVGKNGQFFYLLKYRSTYRTSVDQSEGWQKEGKNIYTKIGRLLRKSYLDELPQIINILRGEMSFVGPRPERPEFIEKLEEKIPFYRTRLLTKPGLTGWAQINMRDDAAAQDAPEKMQYDLYYIKNRSLALDLLIALKTAGTLLHRQGR